VPLPAPRQLPKQKFPWLPRLRQVPAGQLSAEQVLVQ
jgi:hypothetical protein